MSTSQNLNAQQGSPRPDDVPIVQTKAKLNQGLVRGTASEFGMDSMFESSRKRQTLADEDAPPMTSVADIPHEAYVDSAPAAFQPRSSTFGTSSLFKPRTQPSAISNGIQQSRQQRPTQEQQVLYLIVFGYPQDRYSVTVEYFKSLGDTTGPDLNTEIMNCFKIGYRDPGDAMRAVRKNGEVLGGSYMVGVKWADPALAEALLGQLSLVRSTNVLPDVSIQPPAGLDANMAVDSNAAQQPHYGTNTPSVGTPIRLAPSAAAFRRATGSADKVPPPNQPGLTSSRSWISGGAGRTIPPPGMDSTKIDVAAIGGKTDSVQSRSVLGHVSDLIFGW